VGEEGVSELAGPFVQGFFLQAGLIMALGAQNLYVLETGLKRRKHWQVAALCSACDALLIALGVFGAGQAFLAYPFAKLAVGALGVAFLFWYAAQKLREGLTAEVKSEARPQADLSRPLAAALAFSLLNPHVYLDTVVLIGGFSTQFPEAASRAAFGGGAAAFSTIWFFGLAGLAALMSRALTSPAAARRIAFASAAILFVLGCVLSVEVFQWAMAWAQGKPSA
jgi:L-lysine exporter family protein LysE/ArgO